MKNITRTSSYIQLICVAGFQVILFFVFLGRLTEADSVNKHETLLRIAFPTDERSKNKFELLFSGPDILDKWKKEKKIFIKIGLTGELDEDKKRIEFIKTKARELKYTYDTIHILKVHFTEDNTYGQFVELVNIMNKDRHKRYMLYKDDFYILGETPPEQIDLR
ncbi:MAG: hypothetical protein ABI921_15125 [Panacibacter sp.]